MKATRSATSAAMLGWQARNAKTHRRDVDDARAATAYGLEKFADIAGGSFAQIEVDADPTVDRMLRETSAYYLVTVPTEPSDRDGKEHFIRLTVKERGATVRHRKVVVIPKQAK